MQYATIDGNFGHLLTPTLAIVMSIPVVPTVFALYCLGLLPTDIKIYGYARSAKEDAVFRTTLLKYLKPAKGQDDETFAARRDEFLELCVYRRGGYDSTEDMSKVVAEMAADEGTATANRLFYFAIPPTVFATVSRTIKAVALSTKGWNRTIIEKPFGRDLESSAELSAQIAECFTEDMVYRIDHYLGKEMVQNLMVMRFGNSVFEPLWNRHHISSVQVTFKEPFGTEGRGGYFDTFGIVRDVMQNHLLQVLSLVAMEPPVSMSAEDVRDEKVKVLRCIPPIKLEEMVLGQYGTDATGKKPGYHDDETVPPGSRTPTFATAVLHINNHRWHGVPFILKCGKALNERKAEVRIQFHGKSNGLYDDEDMHNNELVIRIQPDEAVYLKVMAKRPGLEARPIETELDLSYSKRHASRMLPDAYARLILDVIRGDRSHFVRDDELAAAWKIFTPCLKRIDAGEVQPYIYSYGSRGPPASDILIKSLGYEYSVGYAAAWHAESSGASGARDAVDRVVREFTQPTERLAEIRNAMLDEMERGLAGAESSLKMIPSYVVHLPNGDEVGSAWAMDLGGTNVRVVEVPLLGGGKVGEAKEFKKEVPASVRSGPGDALFRYLAEAVVESGCPKGATLGFTFSFPTAQTSINSGTLIEWTKSWSAVGVPGTDVVDRLRSALAALGHEVNISALVNDTVGTLVAHRYEDPSCRVGIILGTGTNAAYVERASNILKWEGSKEGEMVVNMEWGGFGSGEGGRRLLPIMDVDQLLDAATPNMTKQRFEKMISGEYLGEMARLTLMRLAREGGVWTGDAAPGSGSPLVHTWKFKSEYMSPIATDTTENLDEVDRVLTEQFHVAGSTLEDRKVVQLVCELVAKRAARLVAAALAAVVAKMGHDGLGCSAGIDGSVYRLYPGFRRWVQEALLELECPVKVDLANDGSGQGAALIAFMA